MIAKLFLALFFLLYVVFILPGAPTSAAPSERVAFEQNLNRPLPLSETFRGEDGKAVPLRSFFGTRPVILVLAYYGCPNLCTIVLNALLESARDLKSTAGKDYEIVIASIDPSETPKLASEKKERYLRKYGRPDAAANWHFLTGDEAAIQTLAAAVGYRYFYDETSAQFAHPAGIVVATPQGKISQYLLGIEYSPAALSTALDRASRQETGSFVQELLLLCFHYDPSTGKYSLAISRVLQASGLLTVLVLAGLAVTLECRRRTRRSSANERV